MRVVAFNFIAGKTSRAQLCPNILKQISLSLLIKILQQLKTPGKAVFAMFYAIRGFLLQKDDMSAFQSTLCVSFKLVAVTWEWPWSYC